MRSTYLFRHGEPVKEYQRCCRGGDSDCELSAEGLRQTQENIGYLVDHYSGNLSNALVVTSGMKRTDIFGEMLAAEGAAHVIDSRLKAIRAGDWEGLQWDEILARWPEQYENCKNDARKLEIPGGESIEDFSKRVRAAWEFILRTDASPLIVVSHNCSNGVIMSDLEQSEKFGLRGQTVGGAHFLLQEGRQVGVVQKNMVLYERQFA